jgi:hypothetical protein
MPRKPPSIDYHQPVPHPQRWPLRRAIEWLTGGCIAAALYCGFMSLALSSMLATPTPAYRQFEQNMRAQAATRPAPTALRHPPFKGQAYMRQPLWSLTTTYFALGFAAAAFSLVVLLRRLECAR